MSKKINIEIKPSKTLHSSTSEEWINKRNGPFPNEKEAMVRFVMDMPEDLHRTIKIYCAERKLKVSHEVRKILQKHFLG
jgi:methyl coenzyme M reductase subunit D